MLLKSCWGFVQNRDRILIYNFFYRDGRTLEHVPCGLILRQESNLRKIHGSRHVVPPEGSFVRQKELIICSHGQHLRHRQSFAITWKLIYYVETQGYLDVALLKERYFGVESDISLKLGRKFGYWIYNQGSNSVRAVFYCWPQALSVAGAVREADQAKPNRNHAHLWHLLRFGNTVVI